jgi:hypothetical protein
MSETLKPCPFCGGEAHTYKNNLWHVACERAQNGCVTMSAFITEAKAIAAWNTRATDGTLTAEQIEEVVFRNIKFYEGGEVDVESIADELRDHYCTLHEEIVRCRNCKHAYLRELSAVYNNHDHDQLWCLRFVGNGMMVVNDDGFCAWGELR